MDIFSRTICKTVLSNYNRHPTLYECDVFFCFAQNHGRSRGEREGADDDGGRDDGEAAAEPGQGGRLLRRGEARSSRGRGVALHPNPMRLSEITVILDQGQHPIKMSTGKRGKYPSAKALQSWARLVAVPDVVQGEPAARADGARCHPRHHHRVRCARSQAERRGRHVHRVPRRRAHAHAQDAHPPAHRVQLDRR